MMNGIMLGTVMLTLLGGGVSNAEDLSVEDQFAKTLAAAFFNKEGLERLSREDYQYESIGLGGTTMRPGPDGFTTPAGPGMPTGGILDNRPFLIHEYWWDDDGHRVIPFDLAGGYGATLETGEIISFQHTLDIQTGLLRIDLGLKIGEQVFKSTREFYVTPRGVLCVRVTDSPGAPASFALQVRRRMVWPRGFFGIMCPEYPEPTVIKQGKEATGFMATASRPGACAATLAIIHDGSSSLVDATALSVGSTQGGEMQVFFIAPGSSLQPADMANDPWAKATTAKSKGFDALLEETKAWWTAYYQRSSISIPDPAIAKWYARSLYYHGVYFGETDIPPGCFSTNPAGFLGTVCPEFDLPFSQFALLYTNHQAEAKRVADWFLYALPQAKKNALSTTLHKTTVTHTKGAFYGPLMGWDGRLFVPPTEGEGIHAYEKYPNANVAAMALAYLDWSSDVSFKESAHRILRETTEPVAEDLVWNDAASAYQDRYSPGGMNASAAEYLLRESIARGVADQEWKELLEKLGRATGSYKGRETIVAGRHSQNSGDAPWLQPLWWFGNASPDDPRVAATYDFIRHSHTGNYVFNNGWMSVFASKLGRADDALAWVNNLVAPGPGIPDPVFDDTCFGENITGVEDPCKTPEIGAHGVLICAVVQMLIDPDSKDSIHVFPAVPEEWSGGEVTFNGFAVKGGLLVSASRHPGKLDIAIENPTGTDQKRIIEIRIPGGAVKVCSAGHGELTVKDGLLTFPEVALPAGERYADAFTWEATPAR